MAFNVHSLVLFCALVRTPALVLRGQIQEDESRQRGKQEGTLALPSVVLMAPGVMTCPSSQRITSKQACDAAFRAVVDKYDYATTDAPATGSAQLHSLPVSWPHLPHGCSVSKGKAYFNTDETQAARGDSAVLDVLHFRTVCTSAAYEKLYDAKFCQGQILYNGGGAVAQGNFQSQAACQEECDLDPRCKFFLWKNEPGTSWTFHCATFQGCSAPAAYADGKKAMIFKKLDVLAPSTGLSNEMGRHTVVQPDAETEHGGIPESSSFHVRRTAPPSGPHFKSISPELTTELASAIPVASGDEKTKHDKYIKEIAEVYIGMDTNRTGFISKAEWMHAFTDKTMVKLVTDRALHVDLLKKMLAKMYSGKSEMSKSAIASMFDQLDKDKSGQIDIREFVLGAHRLQYGSAAPWFHCSLVAGSVKMSWRPDSAVVMTKNVTRTDKSGWKWQQTVYHRGNWSIEGDNVLIKWEALPPWRLRTVDGGHSFRSTLTLSREAAATASPPKAKQFLCTKPPADLKRSISIGMREAAFARADATRSEARLYSSFVLQGCRQATMPVRRDTYVLTAGMTLEACFTHCAKLKGMKHFGLTRGDTCFCSQVPAGKTSEEENCDVKCNGNPEQSCGGLSSYYDIAYASIYTMVDCRPPGAKELREDATARLARLRALYSEQKMQSCGQAKGNLAKIEGSPVLSGTPIDCQQACLAGRGAGKCHGFTYDGRRSKCTFHIDAFHGKPEKNEFFSCFFKKSVPLMG